MAKKEYTYTCMVEYPDGRVENLKELPNEEQERLAVLWGNRMAAAFSEYYSNHPEEFARL